MDRRGFLALGLGAVFAPAAAWSRADEPGAVDLEAIRAAAGAPALAAAVAGPEGLLWRGAAGVRRTDAPTPVTAADLWHLGSNTKAMTAALFARQAEQGALAWGQPLAELFPDLAMDPAFADVPFETLLQHRAGLADPALMPGWMAAAWVPGAPVTELRAALAERALTRPPDGQPGAFAYGNANYIVAGAALERLTGRPWEELIRAELFDPLGMARAGFGAPQGEQPWGHRPDGQPKDPATPGADNPPALGPAGTVHADLEGYGRFLRLFLTGGGDLLSADSLRRLTTPPEGAAYALGWGVRPGPDWARGPLLTHDGSNSMWLARAVVAPGRGLAFIVAANHFAAGRAAADRTVEALVRAFAA